MNSQTKKKFNTKTFKKLSKRQEEKILAKRWVKKREHIHQLSNDIHRLRLNITKTLNEGIESNEKTFLTALVIALQLKTGERVGNKASASNGHKGVTGLCKSNIEVVGDKVHLNYIGKSGVKHEKSFSDKTIAKALKQALKNSPNKFVFTTKDGYTVSDDRVNRYLSDYSITSKDMRGYFANHNIISRLKKLPIDENENKRKRVFNNVVRNVAQKVGHGSATLKKHYMIPELPIEYIQRLKIIEMKNIGYYKDGGHISKNYSGGSHTAPKEMTIKISRKKKRYVKKRFGK